MMKHSKLVLPIIIISQFCCTSLWFAGNGVMKDLVEAFNLEISAVGHLTSAVQFGFILGTLIFALLTIVDRFSPSKVFFVCAIIGSLFNLTTILDNQTIYSLITIRFCTGFFLAGIYPVGMKIAADYYDKGLGLSLGYLVGALVIGTAFPHFLKVFDTDVSWQYLLVFISIIAAFGGISILLFVPNGPYRKVSQKLQLGAWSENFKDKNFRAAAFGYFGHMWELYAFWAFIPLMLSTFLSKNPSLSFNVPLWSFLIIAIGGLACVTSGYLSLNYQTKRIAFVALLLSCLCCLVSPFFFQSSSQYLFLGFLLFWGVVVIADSPLFSTLVAQNAIPKFKGTALTMVNCIGFSITIISIQLINYVASIWNPSYIFMLLAIGPIFGLIALYKKT
jgi:MFS family permease